MIAGAVLQKSWDARAAANFVCGGIGTGLVVWAAIAQAFGLPWALAMTAGAALVACGLLAVWLEIGRPLRSANVLLNPRRSWMSREAAAAGALFVLIAIALAQHAPWASAGAALAALAFVGCQGRMLRAAKGVPAWRQPAMPALIVVSSLTDGLAAYVVLDAISGAAALRGAGLAGPMLLALAVALRWLVWHRYRIGIAGAAPRAVAEAVARLGRDHDRAAAAAIALAVAAGVALPFAPLAPTADSAALAMIALAAIATLGCGAWLRYGLIRKAAFLQGIALPRLPVRGQPAIVTRGTR